jgi:glycosyltransferase involved in cell wall biosynthesis
MSRPLVSVVMPAFNAERYVSDAIRSVLGQTASDIELVIVDDCSTDSTVGVVGSFNDPRLRLIRRESNGGVATALDEGIAEAKSDTIALIGADDVYAPTKLEEQLLVLQEKTVVYTGWYRLGVDGRTQYHFLKMHEGSFATHLARGRHGILLASMIFSKSEAQKVGLFDPSLRVREDTDFALKMFEGGNMFVGIPRALYGYRFVPHSLTAVGGRQSYRALYDILMKHRGVIDMNDEGVKFNLASSMIASRRVGSAARWVLRHPSMARSFYQCLRDPGRMERAFEKSKQYEMNPAD